MCGVCGFVDLAGEHPDLRIGSEMIRMLRHRGPNSEGRSTFTTSDGSGWSVFLGHTRLKVIDLTEAAAQPMANENGRISVIFNGEIYNFKHLRRVLEQKGHIFRSKSDTEVIVHAYEQFGDACVRYLDGMFAFVLFDSERRRLLLARDRTGKKPLYYSFDGRRFSFASEIKALTVCDWVDRHIAEANLPEYFIYGYVPTPRTIYRSIYSVPPASYLVFDENGLGLPQSYWHLEFSTPANESDVSINEAAEQVRHLLRIAVEKRLVSDVPLGALLSGGIDSSVIVGLMSELATAPVHTFSIGFDDHASYDERPFAAMVARHFDTHHTEFVVRPDALGMTERLLWHHDQPYGDSSAIPTFLVSKLAKEYVTVALNGDGGDEVFGGYDRFLAALIAHKTPALIAPLGRLASHLFSKEDAYKSNRRRVQRFFEQASQEVDEQYLGWIAYFKPHDLKWLLNSDAYQHVHESRVRDSLRAPLREAAGAALLHRLMYANFVTYLPDDLHIKMDRMSMANSLETRSPMLDTTLIEYVASLPASMKIRFGNMKYLLRRAFKHMLPAPIVKRSKHGFGAPLGRWFRGSFREPFRECVLSKESRIRAYLNPSSVETLFMDHQAGREQGYRLWIIFNFELWLRMIERPRDWTPSEPLVAEVSEGGSLPSKK